jgi:hypothetical protein
MEYILIAGHTRFEALKKLGYKKVPCYIKAKQELITLPIEDVKILDKENSRLALSGDELNHIMLSIKNNGLSHPLVVGESSSMTKADFISDNLEENLHRNDLTPSAIINKVKQLQEEGLNIDEITIRLSLPKSKILELLNLEKYIPRAAIERSRNRNSRKKSGLTQTQLNVIANRRIKGIYKEKLIIEAEKQGLSSRQLETISRLIQTGIPIDEAILNVNKVYRHDFCTLTYEEPFQKLCKKYNCNGSKLVNKMLKGEISLSPNVFVYGKI